MFRDNLVDKYNIMRPLVTLLVLGVSCVTSDPCPDPGLDGEAWTVVQRSGYVKITSGQVTIDRATKSWSDVL